MKSILFALHFIILVFLSCSHEIGPSQNSFIDKEIEVNGIWVYRNNDYYIGADYRPQKVTSYSASICFADTIIEGRKFYSFRERAYYPQYFYVDTINSTYYVSYGMDSVIILNRKKDYTLIGIGKRARQQQKKQNSIRFNSLDNPQFPLLSKKFGENFNPEICYDTTVFGNYYYPVVFPLEIGKEWYYRHESDTIAYFPIKRRYLGNETVALPVGEIEAWKIQWDWKPYINDPDLKGYDWWTKFGIVKRHFDFGTHYTTYNEDFDSIIYDTIQGYSILEFCGEDISIIPDVKPFFTDEKIATAMSTVAKNWDFSKFIEWYDTLYNYCINKQEYEQQLTFLQEEIDFFITYVWGDTGVSYTSQVEYLNTHVLPTPNDGLHFFNAFLVYVIAYSPYIQGWVDCNYNWKDTGVPFKKVGDWYFYLGNSKARQELFEYMYTFNE